MVLGFMPVVPLVVLSSLAMILVSLVTPAPSRETVERYFPRPGDVPRTIPGSSGRAAAGVRA
jgi:hypothetical protein